MPTRRNFLLATASAAAFGQVPAALAFDENVPLPATEDLMQEHGVLQRIMLIYDALAARLCSNGKDCENFIVMTSSLFSQFIQDHHERIEELYVFPVLSRDSRYAPLTATLVAQHRAGGELVDRLVKLRGAATRDDRANALEAATLMQQFVAMFRPHAAREDTVIFPALRKALGPDRFEEYSREIRAFEAKMRTAVLSDIDAELSSIETALGIHDLAQYTARL